MVEIGLGEEKSLRAMRDPVTTISSVNSSRASVAWACAGAVSAIQVAEITNNAHRLSECGDIIFLVAMFTVTLNEGKGTAGRGPQWLPETEVTLHPNVGQKRLLLGRFSADVMATAIDMGDDRPCHNAKDD